MKRSRKFGREALKSARVLGGWLFVLPVLPLPTLSAFLGILTISCTKSFPLTRFQPDHCPLPLHQRFPSCLWLPEVLPCCSSSPRLGGKSPRWVDGFCVSERYTGDGARSAPPAGPCCLMRAELLGRVTDWSDGSELGGTREGLYCNGPK